MSIVPKKVMMNSWYRDQIVEKLIHEKNDLFSINATSSTVWPKYDGTSTQRNSYE